MPQAARLAASALGAIAACGALLLGAGPAMAAGGLTGRSAIQVVQSSLRASSGASSVTMDGHFNRGGQITGFHVSVTSGNGVGTLTLNGNSEQLIKIGKSIYLKGDRAFWIKNGGTAAAELAAGRWVKVPGDAFQSFFNTHELLSQLGPDVSRSTFVRAGVAVVGGVAAVVVAGHEKANPSNGGRLYVAARGPPYILKIAASSNGTVGSIIFSNYNKPVHVTRPAHYLDLSSTTG